MGKVLEMNKQNNMGYNFIEFSVTIGILSLLSVGGINLLNKKLDSDFAQNDVAIINSIILEVDQCFISGACENEIGEPGLSFAKTAVTKYLDLRRDSSTDPVIGAKPKFYFDLDSDSVRFCQDGVTPEKFNIEFRLRDGLLSGYMESLKVDLQSYYSDVVIVDNMPPVNMGCGSTFEPGWVRLVFAWDRWDGIKEPFVFYQSDMAKSHIKFVIEDSDRNDPKTWPGIVNVGTFVADELHVGGVFLKQDFVDYNTERHKVPGVERFKYADPLSKIYDAYLNRKYFSRPDYPFSDDKLFPSTFIGGRSENFFLANRVPLLESDVKFLIELTKQKCTYGFVYVEGIIKCHTKRYEGLDEHGFDRYGNYGKLLTNGIFYVPRSVEVIFEAQQPMIINSQNAANHYGMHWHSVLSIVNERSFKVAQRSGSDRAVETLIKNIPAALTFEYPEISNVHVIQFQPTNTSTEVNFGGHQGRSLNTKFAGFYNLNLPCDMYLGKTLEHVRGDTQHSKYYKGREPIIRGSYLPVSYWVSYKGEHTTEKRFTLPPPFSGNVFLGVTTSSDYILPWNIQSHVRLFNQKPFKGANHPNRYFGRFGAWHIHGQDFVHSAVNLKVPDLASHRYPDLISERSAAFFPYMWLHDFITPDDSNSFQGLKWGGKELNTSVVWSAMGQTGPNLLGDGFRQRGAFYDESYCREIYTPTGGNRQPDGQLHDITPSDFRGRDPLRPVISRPGWNPVPGWWYGR